MHFWNCQKETVHCSVPKAVHVSPFADNSWRWKSRHSKSNWIGWLCYNLKVCYIVFIFARFVRTHISFQREGIIFSRSKQCKKYFCWYVSYISKIMSLWSSLFSYGLLYISLSFWNRGKKILLEQPRNRPGGVRPASQNPYPIYDRNLRFLPTLFMIWQKIWYPIYDLTLTQLP